LQQVNSEGNFYVKVNRAHAWKKAKIVVTDNKGPLLVLCVWFLGGFLVYFLGFRQGIWEAVKSSFFFKYSGNDFSVAYVTWSQGIVFGVIFSLLVQNTFAKYIPERSCRMIAKEMRGHILIIGYTHLGERLVSYFREKKMPYCLIEKDKEKVDELLRLGEPVIVDNAKEMDALTDANISNAKVVILASNNLETTLIVTKRARQFNKNCCIITRCFQDEFTEIIESLGANEVISSSKNAFDNIIEKLKL
jgi:hypothetical protein